MAYFTHTVYSPVKMLKMVRVKVFFCIEIVIVKIVLVNFVARCFRCGIFNNTKRVLVSSSTMNSGDHEGDLKSGTMVIGQLEMQFIKRE